MGKRNRKQRVTAAVDVEVGMTRTVVKETMEIVNILLEKCSNPFGAKGREWEEYLEVHQLVEKLQKKQAAYVMPHSDRATGFPAFVTWLKQNNVDLDAISIDKFDIGGYGLKANREIKESELIMSVPYKLMMTTLTAKSSPLGPLIKGDRMLQSMPSVALSLHVLCERAAGNSFWAPYINILPESYSTPLYFSTDEVKLLKGSPAFIEALNQFRNISRQYAYFFKQFQAIDDVLKIPIRNMCFDDYRWAVSTVMTRQNQIPNRRGEQTVISLIPVWDMCNHDNGHVTTDYDLKKDCTQCYSLRNFNKDEQVYIFYGERSNADLLVHNGFIFPENQYDKLNIKLGISKNDHLYAMKSEVLARLSLVPSRVFGLQVGPDPVDNNMIAYLRVFCMDQSALDGRLRGENSSKLLHQLRDFGLLVSVENEKKCWSFLETRAQLLLRTYPTTREQDEQLLAGGAEIKLSLNAQMAIELRLAEKKILETTMVFAQAQRDEVDELVRQHLEEISLGMKDLGSMQTTAVLQDDTDDLRGLNLAPSSDWDINRGVVIEEIHDDGVSHDMDITQQAETNHTVNSVDGHGNTDSQKQSQAISTAEGALVDKTVPDYSKQEEIAHPATTNQEQIAQLTIAAPTEQEQSAQPTVAALTKQEQSAQPTVAAPTKQEQTAQPTVAAPTNLEQTAQPTVAAPTKQEQTAQPTVAAPKKQEQTTQPTVAAPTKLGQTAQPTVAMPKKQEQTAQPNVAVPTKQEQTAQPAVAAPIKLEQTEQPTVAAPTKQEQTAQPTGAALTKQEQTAQPTGAAPTKQEQTSQPKVAAPTKQEQTAQPTVAAPTKLEQTAQSTVAAPTKQEQTAQPTVAAPTKQEQTAQPTVAAPTKQEETAQPAVALPNVN